ncbi:MAG TPA: tetratricopeptide repeat protein, partial [Kiloniellales bacterium]
AEFPPDDAALAPLLDTLAESYSAQGSFADAEPLLKRSLTIQERTLANNQRSIARTLASLGFVYESTGRREEAGKLYNRVLAVWQPTLGADDPSVQAARAALAKLAPATATAETPPAAAYRIHLTSIRDATGSEREWRRLQQQFPDLLAGMGLAVTRADLGGDRGVFYRIQGGPLSQGEAEQRCLDFARRAVWCRVVRGIAASRSAAEVSLGDGQMASAGAPAGAGFRVHLTSIRNPGRAEQEWSRLRHIYPALLGGLILAVERADLGAERGVYYRIEGGPLSHAAARTLCGRFAALSVWCGIVPPADGTAEGLQGQLVGRIRRRGPGSASGTWRPDVPRRRRRLDRSLRGPRPEPGARRYGNSRQPR